MLTSADIQAAAKQPTANVAASHLLIVDDDWDIRDSLNKYLGGHGYRVSIAENAAVARRYLHNEAIDLVLLDIMMPGEDGISLCRSIAEFKAVPVIFLTARTDDSDRINGLEIGADDYVCKPFNPRELLARIRVVLRRSTGAGQVTSGSGEARFFAFDRWTLDVSRRRLKRDDGVVLPLSVSEFQLLMVFVERPNVVLSRDRILELTRREDSDVFDRSIDSQVSRFRRKIESNPKEPKLLTTVWGDGYLFTPVVRRL